MSGLYQRTSQSVGSLLDTDLTNPVNDDVLTYEDELWKNKPVAGSNTPIYAGASISKTIGVTTEFDLNTWSSQVADGINVGTTNVFTTPTAGWYSLGFSLECQGTSSNTFYKAILRIYRNGVAYHNLQDDDNGDELNYSITFGGSILIQMTAPTDYITFSTEVNATQYLVTGFASLVKVS